MFQLIIELMHIEIILTCTEACSAMQLRAMEVTKMNV